MDEYVCEYCNKEFSSATNLKNHVKRAKYCINSRAQSNDFRCEFCDKILLGTHSLPRHQKSCLAYKNHVIDDLENQMQNKDEETSRKLKSKDALIRKKNNRIAILEKEKELAYEKGMVAGMEKTIKPQKIVVNNNNKIVNKKLSNMPITHIQPLTIDYVKSRVEEYDYASYKNGRRGIEEYIKNLITLDMEDGTVQKNYVSTDLTRNAFHRLVSNEEWKKDGGAQFINQILNSLVDRAKEHNDNLQSEIKSLGGPNPKTEDLCRLDTDLTPIYNGIVSPKSLARTKLFEGIRNEIRDVCSV